MGGGMLRPLRSLQMVACWQVAAYRWDTKIRLWDTNTGNRMATFIGHKGDVTSVVFSPDGEILVSSGGWKDNTVRLWDIKLGTKSLISKEINIGSSPLTFSPDGQTFASGGTDNTIQLWDPHTGEHKATLTGHTGRSIG